MAGGNHDARIGNAEKRKPVARARPQSCPVVYWFQPGQFWNEPPCYAAKEREAIRGRALVEPGVLDRRADQRPISARNRVSRCAEDDARRRRPVVRNHLPAHGDQRIRGDSGPFDPGAPGSRGDDHLFRSNEAAVGIQTGCVSIREADAPRRGAKDASAGALEGPAQRPRQFSIVDDRILGLPKRKD